MLNSNCLTCPVIALMVVASTHARADELTLSEDARLTGTVRSINGEGVVELLTDLSPEALQLKPDAVKKITFAASDSQPGISGSLIELINGDLLPVRIEGFDGKVLKVVTPDAGALSIPREYLQSMQLGVHRQKAIYSGPRSLEEWSGDVEGSRNWRFTKGALSASGPAVAIRKIDVPSRFVFKFGLKWQVSPNFTVYFADPLTPKADQVDRYFFQFNASGMEIKRESATGQKIQSVILLTRNADDFPTNQVDVEIRVDRKSSRLHLLLNGEPEAAGVDPVANAPIGSGFVFVSSSPSGTPQEIRGIELLDFDNSKERHHSEDRGDVKIDSMISRDDDRWGGHLTEVRPGQDGAVFTFKSDFQDKPLELAEGDVSTVFFAKPEGDPVPAPQAPWVLKLRGDGVLHMASCEFSESGVTAAHPLLGTLQINRGGVTALERLRPNSDPKPEE
ncbi:MAG: hypothetical protein ABIS50_19590 [Luteolibacter sp.]